MCGILGAAGVVVPSLRIADALRALAHRGPDSYDEWLRSDGFVWFGHRRLAIIDLSPGGAQPKPSGSGRMRITYNGELYNYRELKQQLESDGVRFRTESDTEVLIEACERWGVATTLRRANGMFAFALWDEHTRTLTLARDRFGEKPLYIAARPDGVQFASELKGLTALGVDLGPVSEQSVAAYLTLGYLPAPNTIYRDVHQVSPGSFQQVEIAADGRPGALRTERFFDPVETAFEARTSPFRGSHEDGVEALSEAINRSVELRTVSDVPIGALLSGGVDSSLITAAMVKCSTGPVRTFTIGFEEAHADESAFAREVAAHLGTEHTELVVTAKESLDLVPRLPHIFDEPFADASQLPTAIVAALARRHVTVALAGDGGDELFGGYSRFAQAEKLRGALRAPAPLRAAAVSSIGLAASLAERGAALSASRGPTVRRMAQRGRRLGDFLTPDTFADLYWSMISQWPMVAHQGIGDVLDDRRFEPMERMMLFETTCYLPHDLLTKTDRTAMAVSLEGRLPFLDPDVYHLAWSFPLEWKIQGGEKKRILRDVLARDVPKSLFERPKMGFGVPVGEWLRGPLREWAEPLLATDALSRIPGVDVTSVRATWAEHLSGRRNWQGRMWSILMLSAWCEAARSPLPLPGAA